MRSTDSTDSACGRGLSLRGFTLIELMVVLVIMAALSSLVVPSVASALKRTGLASTGAELRDMFDFACMTAITRQRPVDVNLSEDKGVCWVSMRTTSLPWIEDQEQPKGHRLASVRLPKGTRLVVDRDDSAGFAGGGQWEVVTFRNDGTTDDAVVFLENEKGEEYSIEIFGITGEVRGREGRR